jgi:hypothetical protein
MLYAGDAYDDLETLLHSVLVSYHVRNGRTKEAETAATLAPALFFDESMNRLLDGAWRPVLRVWREQIEASPELLKCIWRSTDPHFRPSVRALFEVTLCDEQYRAAEGVILAFGPQHKATFSQLFNAQDESGNTVYASC